MTVVLVSGGYFDESGECFVERVSLDGRHRMLTFTPPDPHRVPAKGFTGLHADERGLLACSFNAIWDFDAEGRCMGRLHMPHFNDLHGLTIDSTLGDLLVCNTGLDAIERISRDGVWRGRFAMTPPSVERAKLEGRTIPRSELSRAMHAGSEESGKADAVTQDADDYYESHIDQPFTRRRVRDYLHPNHVFWTREHGFCVTLLLERAIHTLASGRRVARVTSPPHDGIDQPDGIWATTIDGDVVRARDGNVERVCGLTESPVHGFCRGLALSTEHIVVGVSAVRSTRMQVPWHGGDAATSTSAVVWFDRETGGYVGHVDLTDAARGAKVFALVLDARSPTSASTTSRSVGDSRRT